MNLRKAANELQSIRNDMAGHGGYDIDEMISRVDAIGHWLAKQNYSSKTVRSLTKEASDIRYKLP